eukprot:scaffold336_cov250-Pinguiococcus_pyrenoidosus.AAC.1
MPEAHASHLLGCLEVAAKELDRRFQVEGLDEAGFSQGGGVAYASHFDPIRPGANTELWMLPDPFLDDAGDVLERGSVLLLLVVAEGDVVAELRQIPKHLHGLCVSRSGLPIFLILEQHGRLRCIRRGRLATIPDARRGPQRRDTPPPMSAAHLVDDHIRLVLDALIQELLALRPLVLLVLDARLQQQQALLLVASAQPHGRAQRLG